MCYMARRKAEAVVGVRELRQNLSVYLDRVKRGEALTVTEHGAAVAILRPLPAESSALDRLVFEGRARRPSAALSSLSKPLTLKLAKPLTAILSEDREDRL
jgi:prevent-host-death family protein